MGDFLFAEWNHPVPEVLPNDGWVDAFAPDYLIDHSLFALLVKHPYGRKRFDGGAVIGDRVSTPITDAMTKLASHGSNPLGTHCRCTVSGCWKEGTSERRNLFFNARVLPNDHSCVERTVDIESYLI
ncbi:hypothetical protein NUH87_06230 [Pseudomonas batumici]|uniref:hypothetical protein n=1 Tax=Pseudomonas batumici TaxID=226910 RepID=UPI0030D03CEB